MTDPPTSFLADDIDPSDIAPGDLITLIEASQGDVDTFLASDELQDALEDVAVTPVHERPDTLPGTTQRIETGYDHIYVNVNTDVEGRPIELFTTYGQSGGFTKSMTEAIHNLVTLSLRSNADPENVVDQLRGIRSPKIGYDHGTRVDSIPDAIGLALDRVLNGDLPQVTTQTGKQSSLAQHADSERELPTGASASTNGGRTETPDDTPSPSEASTESEVTADAETLEESEPMPTESESDETSGVPLDASEEVSVSGAPDPEIEPTPTSNAEPETDPNLVIDDYSSEQAQRYQSGDTEPCPDCGSIDIYYSESCQTCQSCGWSECS